MYDKDYFEYRLCSLQYICLYSDIRCILEIKLECNLAKRENIQKLQTIKVCSHFHSFHVAFRFQSFAQNEKTMKYPNKFYSFEM